MHQKNLVKAAFAAAGAGLFLCLTNAASGQTLEIAVEQSPVGLDPHMVTALASLVISGNIYEGLTGIDKNLAVVPELAASWTLSPDRLTYTFTLRKGALFHDGAPVTAADVIASLTRVRDAKTGSPLASRLALVQSMEAKGADTVAITLQAPSGPFLVQLSSIAIVPAKVIESDVASLARKPDGTGPFQFAEWAPDTFILLKRNDRYYLPGTPSLGALKFNIVPEAATRQAGVASGAYQLLPDVDAATAQTLRANKSVTLGETLDLAYTLVGMNVTQPPFDNPKVREALNYALDRDEIVAAAYFGEGEAGGGVSPALKDWAVPVSAYPCFKRDVAKAQTLLKEAGIVGKPAITLKVLGSRQQVVDVAQVVQAQLNKAGFDAKLEVQEQGKFIQDWRASNFQGFVSLNSGSPDPDDYFYRTFRTGGSTNVFKYADTEIDGWLDAARATDDKAQRQTLYKNIQIKLACSGPAAFLAYGKVFSASGSRLGGYAPLATRQTRALRDAVLK